MGKKSDVNQPQIAGNHHSEKSDDSSSIVNIESHVMYSENNDEEERNNTATVEENKIKTTCDSSSEITKEFSNLYIASTSCAHGCTAKNDDFMLKCSKCKRSTHYRCTFLPPYQIFLFTRKSYRLYVCDMCVGELPDEFVERSRRQEGPGNSISNDKGNETAIFQEKIEAMEGIIKSQKVI